ncbi:signal peptidase I [Roseivirga sp.]|uniref:signal peptidase I n=1 Tax=Roseivirga sp. TaxID=1964215 RepID=UPI003B52EBB0
MLDFLKRKNKEEKKEKEKKGFFRELLNDILFALIAVTIIRGLFVEAFAIPTGSMENSMLIGDHLFVSKFHYGARTPQTPIQFPLAHQTFWGIKLFGKEVPSYSDIIQLPSYRLPGLRKPRRNEPVVFNYPPDYKKGFPTDMKTFYVKRCLAIPGDTFEVRNKQVYINGEAAENPPQMLTSFFVEVDRGVHERYMRELGITDYTDEYPQDTYATTALPQYTYKGKTGFYIHTTPDRAEKLAAYNFINSVEEVFHYEGEDRGIFPHSSLYNWSRDFFGPLVMPSKGMTIDLTPENIALYGEAIQHYEHNDDVVISGDEISIEGQKIDTYTFKQGYYFMIGDNRHNSEDSRSWGLVPYDHIVGKPLFIFWSVDRTNPNAGFFERLRFNRMLDLIK